MENKATGAFIVAGTALAMGVLHDVACEGTAHLAHVVGQNVAFVAGGIGCLAAGGYVAENLDKRDYGTTAMSVMFASMFGTLPAAKSAKELFKDAVPAKPQSHVHTTRSVFENKALTTKLPANTIAYHNAPKRAA